MPMVLSLNAGYVDTAGYVALQGLFTAHVTGNFVTFAAAIVSKISGSEAKLLALPVFCVVVLSIRLLDHFPRRMEIDVIRTKLVVQFLLLALAAVLGAVYGPFTDADAWVALGTGMALVAGMAVQNTVHRSHLASAPPSTLMTGTTTQIMIDLADILHGGTHESRAPARARLATMSVSVALFAAGCGLAAAGYLSVGCRCFMLPPLLVLGAILTLRDGEAGAPVAQSSAKGKS
jgi:uncharacterized membrane protein YoaK (UPF0700 family)